MTWDPGQYLNFGGHRLRPALDLLSRIPLEHPSTVIDLGCGAGNVTAVLKARWPEAHLIGLDNSPQMLARARLENPDIEWREADVLDWRPDAPVDVLFSNAVLHWIDEAHETLLPRLLAAVAENGVLAIQMPRNFGEPSHTSLYDAVGAGPWRERLAPMIRDEPTKSAQFYYDLLRPHSRSLDIWETQYVQVVEGEHPVADFVKGSWLKPFLDALDEPERSALEDDYRKRVKAAYPPRSDGRTLFPFRRLFIMAER
jgi:trans-aconitate 2-methyltransferase